MTTYLLFLCVNKEKLANVLPTPCGNSRVKFQSGTWLIEILEGSLLVDEFPGDLNDQNRLVG